MADYVVVDKEQLEVDLTTVSDSIRGLIETEEKLAFPQGMKEAVESYSLDEPLEAQDALIEQIKTALQGKASGGEDYFSLVDTFSFKDLNRFGKKEVELTFSNIRTLAGAFSCDVANETVEKITLNVETAVPAISSLFYAQKGDSTLKCIVLNVNTVNVTSISTMFYLLYALERIEGIPLDLSSTTTCVHVFGQCRSLKEVRFKPDTINVSIGLAQSNLLSDASIQSIIDGLATVETSQTLTLHADVKAKLTETQISTITSKNWTLA